MPSIGASHQNCFSITLFIFNFGKKIYTADHPLYNVNGHPIQCLLQHKDLGVIFTSDFNWTAHYTSISAKAYKTLDLIRRTFKTNCMEAKKNLYTISLVRSQLTYCSQIWRPQDITALERMQ